MGDRLFFEVFQAQGPDALWVSDGTEAGTMMVKELSPIANEVSTVGEKG